MELYLIVFCCFLLFLIHYTSTCKHIKSDITVENWPLATNSGYNICLIVYCVCIFCLLSTLSLYFHFAYDLIQILYIHFMQFIHWKKTQSMLCSLVCFRSINQEICLLSESVIWLLQLYWLNQWLIPHLLASCFPFYFANSDKAQKVQQLLLHVAHLF